MVNTNKYISRKQKLFDKAIKTEVTKNKTTLSPYNEHTKGNPSSHSMNWGQKAGGKA